MDVRTKDLSGALGAVKKAVSSRPGIPALTGVLLEAEAGRIRATATDLEVSIRTAVDGVCEVDGERWTMLVPFRMLADAVKASTGERFTIEPADGDGKAARINGGGVLRLLPVEDFPTLTEDGEHVATIPTDAVRAVLATVLPGCSRDEARPVLTGVLLELEGGGRVCATSTDSYRLHHAETAGAVVDGKAIVPERALGALVKILGAKATGAVAVYLGEYQARFVLPDGLELTVRSIEGEFPNYRQLMPERGADDGVLRYSVDQLAAVLKQAAPYCRDTCPVRLELNGDVTMTASAPDLGAFRAVVPGAVYEGPEMVVAYNPAYLLGAIGAAGAEMWVRDGLKPAAIGTERDPYGRVALVMPVRLPVPVHYDGDACPAPVATADPEPEAPEVEPTATNPQEYEREEREREAETERQEHGERYDVDPIDHGEPGETEPEPEPEPVDMPEDPPDPCPGCGEEHATGVEGCREPGDVDVPVVRSWAEREPDDLDVPVPARPDVEPEPELRAQAIAEHVEWVAGVRAGGPLRPAEPEPVTVEVSSGAEPWAELATLGDVDGVRVRLVTGPDGDPRVDLRRFVEGKRYQGPTRKGFAIRASAAGILAELLLEAAAASES